MFVAVLLNCIIVLPFLFTFFFEYVVWAIHEEIYIQFVCQDLFYRQNMSSVLAYRHYLCATLLVLITTLITDKKE